MIGAINRTHVKITAPSQDEDILVNMKKTHHSPQAVFNVTFIILDILVKWEGSTHNLCISMESGLGQLFERYHIPPGYH